MSRTHKRRSIWFVSFVWFVWFLSAIEPNEPNKLNEPDRPPLSSGWLRLCGIGDFGLGLKRDEFGGGCDTPYIEEDGDEHVA